MLSHERFEFKTGLADVHHERSFVVHDVMGLGEGLQQLGGQGGHRLVFASW